MDKSQELYVGADLMKLICAFLIVFLHTYNHDWGVFGGWVHTTLSPIERPIISNLNGLFRYDIIS